jgi:hypothetical protein
VGSIVSERDGINARVARVGAESGGDQLILRGVVAHIVSELQSGSTALEKLTRATHSILSMESEPNRKSLRPGSGTERADRIVRLLAAIEVAPELLESSNIPKKLLETEFLKLIKHLQPKPEYLNLFKEIVLDVWKHRQSEL